MKVSKLGISAEYLLNAEKYKPKSGFSYLLETVARLGTLTVSQQVKTLAEKVLGKKVLGKNTNFREKDKFWRKIKILEENPDFRQNEKF